MDSESLAAFACFFNLFTTLFLVILWQWARRRLADAQTRLSTLESTLQQTPVTTMAAATVTAVAAPVEQASVANPGAMPLAVPSTQLPVSPLAAEVQALPVAAQPGTPPLAMPVNDQLSQELEPVANIVDQPPFWRNSPLLSWFTRVHVMVQVGMIVLFFGVAFLVKYAADQGWLSLEMRLAAAAGLGVVLTAVGWRVRNKARTYGLALIGGGWGIIYLTTFGAYSLYNLIPASLAFAVFVALGVAYALMAVLNDAWILAFLAVVGAFLAPILASDGGGSHVILFGYYAVVNAGILAIARYKRWRGLNVVGFLFTLLAGVGWGQK